MPRVELTIPLPEALWIHKISTTYADTTFRVSSIFPRSDSVISVIELMASNPDPVLATIDEQCDILDLEIFWKHDGVALLQVEMANLWFFAPIQEASILIETPFTVEDGIVSWELTISTERLSMLSNTLDDRGIEHCIGYVHAVDAGFAENILTELQLEVFLTAFEAGYYDVPRRTTLTDVASTLGVTKSTCSEILHRAESGLVYWFAEDHLERIV